MGRRGGGEGRSGLGNGGEEWRGGGGGGVEKGKEEGVCWGDYQSLREGGKQCRTLHVKLLTILWCHPLSSLHPLPPSLSPSLSLSSLLPPPSLPLSLSPPSMPSLPHPAREQAAAGHHHSSGARERPAGVGACHQQGHPQGGYGQGERIQLKIFPQIRYMCTLFDILLLLMDLLCIKYFVLNCLIKIEVPCYFANHES